MTLSYNPFDWYWSVQDTSPGTQVWASARGQYVALADATYVAWLASGGVATSIDTQANLFTVINDFNIGYFNDHSALIQNVTLIGGTPIQLTNPVARVVQVTPVAGAILELPKANLFGSPPLGQPLIFNTVGRSPNWVLKTFGGGTTVVSSVIDTLLFWMTDNSTQAGTWTGLTLSSPARPTADAQILMSQATFGSDGRWYPTTPSGDLSISDTGVFTLNTVALAKGGTHADLSATGGAHKFLRQNSVGADIDVVQPASSDLSDTTVPAAFTPVDGSGASLTFTGVSVQTCKYGNMVYVYGRLTYPATASGANALISLPSVPASPNYGLVPGVAAIAGGGGLQIIANNGAASAFFNNITTGAVYTNVQLSGATLVFFIVYPAA